MGNLGRRLVHGALWIVILGLLLIGILILLVHPRVFNTNTYIDANSGDLRVETTVCGLRVWDRIRTTPFSREVRRLDIPTPKDRAWQLALKEKGLLGGGHTHSILGRVVVDLESLMRIFAHGEVADQERRVILQKILVSFKDSRLAIGEVRDQVKAMENKVYKEREY